MTRLSTSRPSSSVPNRCCQDGAFCGAKSWASGSFGASSGATIAITSQAPAIVMPTIASGLRQVEPRGQDPAARSHAALAGARDAHVIRIRGSITPYSTSTMKLMVM